MPSFFERRDRWGNDLSMWVVVGMVFFIPLSLWGLSSIDMENEVHNWIPKDNADYQKYEWYRSHFPAEDTVLFTVEGSSLGDPRIDRFVQKVRGKDEGNGRRRGGSKYVARVRSPDELIAQMRKATIPREQAIERLKGILIGAGPIRVRLSDAGRERRDKVVEALRRKSKESLGVKIEVAQADELQAAAALAMAAGGPTEAAADDAHAATPAATADAAANTETTSEPSTATSPEEDGANVIPAHDLVIEWPGMHWDDKKVESFIELAKGLTLPGSSAAQKTLVEDAFQVAGSPVALAIVLSEAGAKERGKAFDSLKKTAAEVGIPETAIHMGGSPVAGHALNQEVVKAAWNRGAPVYELHRRSIVLLSGLVGGVLAIWMLRSFRLAGLALGVSYYTMLVSTALVPAMGGKMNMVLVVMPTLLFVTTLSVAIHLANYWQHAAAVNMKTAVADAVKTAYVPCLWAGLTSTIGQASLATSSLAPVRDFGIYSAIGTLISLVVTLYGLPALLQIWPSKPPRTEDLDNAFWHGLAAWIAPRHKMVSILSLAAAGACMYGLVYFQTETKVIRYFADDTRTVKDYRYIEDHLGGIIPVDVIIRFDVESQQELKFLERRELVRRVEREMEALPDISAALSLSDFLPDENLPGPNASKATQVKFAATSRKAESRVKGGEQTGARSLLAMAEDTTAFNAPGDELWRITAQVAVMSDLNYNDLRVQLDNICRDVLRTTSGHSTEKVPSPGPERTYHPGASHIVTGMIPLFLATQQELLDSFISSFAGAFGMIALVVMIVLRHPVAGILAMIPNVLPIGAVFGLISWSGLQIDIGSTVTASIALGITIDGTLHLITWFRIGIQQGKTRAEAVSQALGHCGPAMWQTTLVVSVGLLMLYPSDLILISRFGWLMAALLAAASVSDLFLTPALLAGPLGYIIQRCTSVQADLAQAAAEEAAEIESAVIEKSVIEKAAIEKAAIEKAAEKATIQELPVAIPEVKPRPVSPIPGKPHLDKRGVRIRRVD